ncbi:MAG: hypothetical protein AAF798_03235 [Bacteroidota bacterium]
MANNRPDYVPDGYNTINPYLLVDQPEQEMLFLMSIFDAQELDRIDNAQGEALNIRMQIGDSPFMIGRATPGYPARSSMQYIFVKDVTKTYESAIALGCQSVMPPTKQNYGMFDAGIMDLQGIEWWIAQPLNP